MTHTPGEWNRYLDEDGNAVAVTKWATGPQGGHVAYELAKMPLPNEYRTRDQINANAILIAAAPEILGELGQCLAEIEEAANMLRPTFPRTATIYDAAAVRVRTLLERIAP